ncbi:MAG: hypothetical protein NTV45_07150, partial [Firmicutes bacterium]|nr:hypothetical protein [Bacillota bacterium]
RDQGQNQLVQGRGQIYLITQAFLQYHMRRWGLPGNLRCLVRMWPLSESDPELFSLGQLEIVTLEQDQLSILSCNPDQKREAGKILVYANLAKTIAQWRINQPDLKVESGIWDMRQRRAVRLGYIKASDGVLLSDGTHTPGRSYINGADELVLADSPLGGYELQAFTDYLPAQQKLPIKVSFNRASLDYNRQYLQRLYPGQDTVEAVFAVYLNRAAKLGPVQADKLAGFLDGRLEGQYSRLEILSAVRILADLGLCHYEKSGSISAIIHSEAEISAYSLSGTPYYMEGVAEKEILSAWETHMSRVLGW